MKKDIHPESHPVVFHDTSSGAKFVATSTMKSKETEKIDGKEHFVIKVETSSASHPFYTGKRRIAQTGRVERFNKKRAQAQQHAESKVKKVKPGEDAEEVAKATAEAEEAEEPKATEEVATEEQAEEAAEEATEETAEEEEKEE